MIKRLLNFMIHGIIFGVFVLFMACDDEESISPINSDGDFYPMKPNAMWQYISEGSCDQITCNIDYPNSFQYVWEDTVVNGKTYTTIRSTYDVVRLARREGNKYYEWSIYDNQEYLFLDVGLSPGDSWIKSEGDHWKTEIFAEKPLSVLNVKGKEYRDVIVMREEWFYENGPYYSYTRVTHRYYARDIGEILSESPAVPLTFFNETRLSLFKYEY